MRNLEGHIAFLVALTFTLRFEHAQVQSSMVLTKAPSWFHCVVVAWPDLDLQNLCPTSSDV
eukprot:551280-Pleurochrysis_carterae.AAC.1